MPERVRSLSILIPVRDERDNIGPLFRNLVAALDGLDAASEIIFVNDGSRDGSGAILDELAANDRRVKVIHFRRNYGQTAALMAGIGASGGDVIVPMDADGQNDPADIPGLLAKLAEGYDVVSGWRKDRQDGALTRVLPSAAANRLLSYLFDVKLHDHGCTLKAYRRAVIENIRLYGEMHRYIPIYASWEGARVAEIPVKHHPRRFGVSKYGAGRALRVFLDIVLLYFMDRAFDRPIQFFGKLAGLSWLAAFAIGVWALWMKVAGLKDLVESPLPLLVVFLALSGLIFLLLGVLAEQQMRVYYESRRRPPYSILKAVNLDRDDAPRK